MFFSFSRRRWRNNPVRNDSCIKAKYLYELKLSKEFTFVFDRQLRLYLQWFYTAGVCSQFSKVYFTHFSDLIYRLNSIEDNNM